MDLSGLSECPMSEDFAVLLGLKESKIITSPGGYARDEIERLQFLMAFVQRNKMELEDQQDAVWSRFSALYLPDTVSRYLDLPSVDNLTDVEFKAHYELYNAYLEMLVQIQHIAYFAKYLRSTKPIASPGKRLPSILAQRLLGLAPYLDDRLVTRTPSPNRPTIFYESFTGSCIQLLSTLLAVFVKVPDQESVVPTATRRGLMSWLQKWGKRYGSAISTDPFLGDVCLRTWAQLNPDFDVKRDVKTVRKQLKNLDRCALPSCNVKDNCKVCARCKTACYCSVEHQRAHWNLQYGAPHKLFCHQTQY